MKRHAYSIIFLHIFALKFNKIQPDVQDVFCLFALAIILNEKTIKK